MKNSGIWEPATEYGNWLEKTYGNEEEQSESINFVNGNTTLLEIVTECMISNNSLNNSLYEFDTNREDVERVLENICIDKTKMSDFELSSLGICRLSNTVKNNALIINTSSFVSWCMSKGIEITSLGYDNDKVRMLLTYSPNLVKTLEKL